MPFSSDFSQLCRSYNPGHAVTCPVWANPRSLATTYGIIVIFSSCGYLDVSVPHVRFPYGISRLLGMGSPIRISTDQLALADPRGFSQLITSFLASESLGIPRAPLFTYSSTFSKIPRGIPTVTVSTQYVNELDRTSPAFSRSRPCVKCVRLLRAGFFFPERRCSSRTFRYGYLVTT